MGKTYFNALDFNVFFQYHYFTNIRLEAHIWLELVKTLVLLLQHKNSSALIVVVKS